MNHLIIGGSDAGISAGLRIKELQPDAQVTLLVADAYPNFSICGLPFYLSGEVPHWTELAHRSADDLREAGLAVQTDTRALSIDPDHQTVLAQTPRGEQTFAYDRLLIATGAVSRRPPIEGLDLPGVFFLRWMEDSFAMKQYMAAQQPRSALIIGAGYIGMEMADALRQQGMEVSVVEFGETVLSTVDPELGQQVQAHLAENGVQVFTQTAVKEIQAQEKRLIVRGEPALTIPVDMVLVATGGTPNVSLGTAIGLATEKPGALVVNQKMETERPNIYAAGDCALTYHQLLKKHTYLPLGSTAHKQGRIAGENMLGGNRLFQGSLGTQVVKIFERVVGRTGFKDAEARAAGYQPRSVDFEGWDHKAYYPGATPLHIRLTGDTATGRLLGAQMLGTYPAEIAKRIDIFAAALSAGMTIEALNDLDLSYTPPLSSPWDPVQMAAQAWSRAARRALV
jgi:NADPH-dependent 2,4-dienoyl-CoA reductase/sulfur reductase-like enzyme